MKIYWTMNSVPELDGLDPKEKRKRFREIHKHGRKEMGIMPIVYLCLAGCVIAAGAILLGLSGTLVYAAIGGLIGMVSVVVVQSPAIERGRVWYRSHYGEG